MRSARSIRVRGVVQGVGFRPFVFRLARARSLAGWVLNGPRGVEIHIEGGEADLDAFLREMEMHAPPPARVADVEVEPAEIRGLREFTIHESSHLERPTVRVSPDLPVCDACLEEMFSAGHPRSGYPYINCSACGPRYSVIRSLPYDRPNTSMSPWPMDSYCAAQYHDPSDRRFHAQPVACRHCGPRYYFSRGHEVIRDEAAAISAALQSLRDGSIVALKGIGGYHLACDALNSQSIRHLRNRKFRKEKPFALMARNLAAARKLVRLSRETELLLESVARPIVLAPASLPLDGVAPDSIELGIMLPYTPLHHLLFAGGAPEVLVMTSANRSSEPIAYRDEEALETLSGIADAFLIGERPIVRRVDDSIVRQSPFGAVILRRGRGYAPSVCASLPSRRPILATGAGLKNSVTLVVEGQAFVSQHIGDLDHYECLRAFEETIRDLVSMYQTRWNELTVVHDLHPQYFSTIAASRLPGSKTIAVQHHRAHIASVLAERGELHKRVLGVAFDGTGYGVDGSIWGGEFLPEASLPDSSVWRTCAPPCCPEEMPPRVSPSRRRPGSSPRSATRRTSRRSRFASPRALLTRLARPERVPLLSGDFDGKAVRYGSGFTRLHARIHVRRPGRHVARAPCRRRTHRSAISFSFRWEPVGFPPSARGSDPGPVARAPGRFHRASLPKSDRAWPVRCRHGPLHAAPTRYRRSLRWRLSKQPPARGHPRYSERRPPRCLDQPRGSTQRRRHQPGAGRDRRPSPLIIQPGREAILMREPDPSSRVEPAPDR